jgi:hypothetical protein
MCQLASSSARFMFDLLRRRGSPSSDFRPLLVGEQLLPLAPEWFPRYVFVTACTL